MISVVITCSYDISRYHVQLWYQWLSRAVMISPVITCSYDISGYHVQLWYQSLSRAVMISVVITCSYEISRYHAQFCYSSLSSAVPVMSLARTCSMISAVNSPLSTGVIPDWGKWIVRMFFYPICTSCRHHVNNRFHPFTVGQNLHLNGSILKYGYNNPKNTSSCLKNVTHKSFVNSSFRAVAGNW